MVGHTGAPVGHSPELNSQPAIKKIETHKVTEKVFRAQRIPFIFLLCDLCALCVKFPFSRFYSHRLTVSVVILLFLPHGPVICPALDLR
jgi:hypothetical protein